MYGFMGEGMGDTDLREGWGYGFRGEGGYGFKGVGEAPDCIWIWGEG
jgi:hypothetical protein